MRSKGRTLRAKWLGRMLRDLRESAGLSLTEAGAHIVRDKSTISRMETGYLPARMAELRELLKLFGVDDPQLRAAMESLARDIWVKGWWEDYVPDIQVPVIDLAWLEARTNKLRHFSLPVIHGLLQTPEYAEAVMRTVDPDVPDDRMTAWLEFRMMRQDVLGRLEYTGILDEGVLQRSFGAAQVMREQLAHLLNLSERSNVTIRVLPFSASGLVGPEGGFTLFTLPAPFPLVAQVGTDASVVQTEMPKTARLAAAFDRFGCHALDAEESRVFIKTRMEEFA
ncbi:MAG TPA: helix-turn-helix transcriptional regulator [Micromonosporaceae bacterium]